MKDIKKSAKKASSLLKLVSNETRLLVLCMLVEGERSVSELLEKIDISQSALSQHLAKLRKDGLVDYKRDHRVLNYYICNNDVKKIIKTLHNIYCK